MKVLFRSYELDTGNIIIGHYVEEQGYYMNDGIPDYDKPCTREYIYEDGSNRKCEVTPEYLSINFEDMIDSEGNKIFASLSEDGKGGSKSGGAYTYVFKQERVQVMYTRKNLNDKSYMDAHSYHLDTVTGIQE